MLGPRNMLFFSCALRQLFHHIHRYGLMPATGNSDVTREPNHGRKGVVRRRPATRAEGVTERSPLRVFTHLPARPPEPTRVPSCVINLSALPM